MLITPCLAWWPESILPQYRVQGSYLSHDMTVVQDLYSVYFKNGLQGEAEHEKSTLLHSTLLSSRFPHMCHVLVSSKICEQERRRKVDRRASEAPTNQRSAALLCPHVHAPYSIYIPEYMYLLVQTCIHTYVVHTYIMYVGKVHVGEVPVCMSSRVSTVLYKWSTLTSLWMYI